MTALGRAATSAAHVAALALGALMLLPPLAGYERYVITGGSMGGSVPRGSIVYARTVAVGDLRAGDVITYDPPAGSGETGKVTHRIVWTGRGATGAPAFQTKGDANRSADPWRFELRRPTQARMAFHIPYAGYLFAALGIRWVRMLVVGGPALLVAFGALAGAWRESGEIARREASGT